MGDITIAQAWAFLVAGAGVLVLLFNALEKVCTVWRAIKAPGSAQDDRIASLEARADDADGKLDTDKKRLDSLEKAVGLNLRAQLALLEHGLHGNNVTQMQDAKNDIETYLINR